MNFVMVFYVIYLVSSNACIFNFSAETESIVVNVLEKKVILTFRISTTTTIGKVISKKVTPLNRTPSPKVAIIKRIFRSSRG